MSASGEPVGDIPAGDPAPGQVGVAWTIEHRRGPVTELFALDDPPRGTTRLARLYTVERPGLVLGSTQKAAAADGRRAASAGVEVLRRRSGGGAVLLWPERQVWVDFFLAPTDPLWHDDVTLATGWVGRLWTSVVARFSTAGCSAHTGRLVADRWGRLVCFAGMGPGEVFVSGRKVVGVSQRRSRDQVRIQTAARLRPPGAPAPGRSAAGWPDELDLLDLNAAEREEGRAVLASRSTGLPATEAELTESLLRELQHPG